jgi:hypothetical protein
LLLSCEFSEGLTAKQIGVTHQFKFETEDDCLV